ncbi:Uncharacterised protein [Canicola haemoglobinophilus]|uniref:Uncharacterized protein n=1 Tax=Canicola haemoglobinophilus TaxID=733 RepID=A0AB38HG74_9PAST|nr:hypothetical protein [Canicola haemoglobinophilus]STO55230.1 Uncharacterised protein [Canicola haemoglobinophilus]STO69200.1 Uncharacterised protein [Canicola haemoglobinophilus]
MKSSTYEKTFAKLTALELVKNLGKMQFSKKLVFSVFIFAQVFSLAFAADNKVEPKKISIDGSSYTLVAPTNNAEKIKQNLTKVDEILAEKRKISEQINSTEDKQILEEQFENNYKLMIEQDNLLKDIFQQGNYSHGLLVKFINMRKSFAHSLKKDFEKFVQKGIADRNAADRFLQMFDVNTSQYESVFIFLFKNYLQ